MEHLEPMAPVPARVAVARRCAAVISFEGVGFRV